LRTRGKFFNYSTANGHAPTETSGDEEKDRFFDAMETGYDISPRNDIKIVLGDFNAQVSKENVNFPTNGKIHSSQFHRQWILATVCSMVEHDHRTDILPTYRYQYEHMDIA
jgi:hypothetical protein